MSCLTQKRGSPELGQTFPPTQEWGRVNSWQLIYLTSLDRALQALQSLLCWKKFSKLIKVATYSNRQLSNSPAKKIKATIKGPAPAGIISLIASTWEETQGVIDSAV